MSQVATQQLAGAGGSGGTGAGSPGGQSAGSSLWILGSWKDLLLFIGPPLVIIPLFHFAYQNRFGEWLALWVLALGGVGHHLPGMMRAYGDKDLFSRFKWRFIFAPIFLATICGVSAWKGYSGVDLMLLFWGIWHSLAQTYGFMRIYDAKVKSFSSRTSRLDRAMCTVWFVGGALFTDTMTANLLIGFYNSGGPLLSPTVIGVVRMIWVGAAAVITGMFLANFVITWRNGQRQNIVKILLLAVTIVYWWFCMTRFDRLIIGLAMFEFFHDMQYLAIVWLFNRNRVDKSANVGGFTRFLFQRRGVLVVLYVAMVLAYGSLYKVFELVPRETIKEVLLGVLMASTFLHYYYDGFIWRVREKSTRDSLGVVGQQGNKREKSKTISEPASRQNMLRHGAYWCLFVVPLVALTVAQAVTTNREEIEWRRAIVDAVPDVARSQMALAELLTTKAKSHDQAAKQLAQQGQPEEQEKQVHQARELREEAVDHFRRSLEIWPDNERAHNKLGLALKELGRDKDAIAHFRRALAINPYLSTAGINLANMLMGEGKLDEAEDYYLKILRQRRLDAKAHFNLGNVYLKKRQLEKAQYQYQQAVNVNPDYVRAHFNLASVYAATNQFDLAIIHFTETLKLDPRHSLARKQLDRVQQAKQGLELGGGRHGVDSP